MKRTGRAEEYALWDTDVPILLISGQADPVGDAGKCVQVISGRMRKAGLKNVTVRLFPGARHDLLHEEKNGAEEARNCIAQWLSR